MYAIRPELLTTLTLLDPQAQERVLEFARSMQPPRAETAAELLAVAREIAFPPEDLAEIARLIEEEFEKVRGDELDVPDFDAR